MPYFLSPKRPAPGTRRWRLRLAAGIAAVLLPWPVAALPYALDELLRLPLESLLQLQIRPWRAAPHAAVAATGSARSHAGGAHHGY